MKKTILSFVVLLSLSLTSFPVSSQSQEVAPAENDHEAGNFITDITLGFNSATYSRVNVEGGFGFMAGAKEFYFFHKNVGVFTGLDYYSRYMSLNVSKSPGWLDIPFGVAFRYKWLGDAKNLLGVGAFYSLPLSDFEDTSGTVALQGGLGFVFYGGTYFSITESFDLGIIGDIRYSFFSPFTQFTTPKMFSVGLGLSARFNY